MATKQINASGGGDYTSLAAWHSALPATLTEPEIAEITGTLVESNITLGSGITTTSTNKIIVRAASGQKYDPVADTGAKVEKSHSWTTILATSTGKHVDIEDIGIINLHTTNTVGITASSDDAAIRRCYISAKEPIKSLYSGVVEYCWLDGRSISSSTGIIRNNWEDPDIIGCTIVGCVTGIDSTAVNGSAHVENTVVYGATTSYSSGSYTGKNNAAGDGGTNTPPGTSPYTSNVVSGDFENTGTGDYHLSSGSSLKTAGATPTAGSGVDFDGDTISGAYPIGMDYVVAAGGSVSLTGSTSVSATTSGGLSLDLDFSATTSLLVSLNSPSLSVSGALSLTGSTSVSLSTSSSLLEALRGLNGASGVTVGLNTPTLEVSGPAIITFSGSTVSPLSLVGALGIERPLVGSTSITVGLSSPELVEEAKIFVGDITNPSAFLLSYNGKYYIN